MGEDMHIRIIRDSGHGISQAIKKAIKDKFENNKDIWSVAEDKLENHKADTWTAIFDLFHKESGDDVSTFEQDGKTSGIKDEWTTLNMNVRTYGDEELVIKSGTWDAILELLGLKTKQEAPQQKSDGGDAAGDGNGGAAAVTGGDEASSAAAEQGNAIQSVPKAPDAEVFETEVPEDDEVPPADVKPEKIKKLKNDKKPPQAIPAPVIAIPEEMPQEVITRLKTTDASKAGQTMDNGDGTSSEYDAKGNIVKDINNDKGRAIRDIERDTNGNITKIMDFGYDDKGNISSTIVRDADGKVVSEVHETIDKKGNATVRLTLNAAHDIVSYNEYKYDRKGRVTKEVHRDADGNVTDYVEYKYDSKGNTLREIRYDAEGKVISRVENTYKKGKQVKTVTTGADGNYSSGYEYEYNENGTKKADIKRSADGKVVHYGRYEYDDDGNRKRISCFDSNGKLEYYFDFRTDSKGNKIFIKRDPSGKELERGGVDQADLKFV